MKLVYDSTFEKGLVYDDVLNEVIFKIGKISHKPTETEMENGGGELSYYTFLDKKIRIQLYVED